MSAQCCGTEWTDRFFSREARRYARRFKRKGLDKSQKHIAAMVQAHGLVGKSVLEVGCGVGGLHLTLLQEGASTATGIDIAKEMIEKARQLSGDLGLSDRTTYHVGDFATLNGAVSPADVLIMDKVVCCYESPLLLINRASVLCRKFLAVSYPRDSIIARFVFKGAVLVGKILRWKFRPYYHEPVFLERIIAGGGFRLVEQGRTVLWQINAYQKV